MARYVNFNLTFKDNSSGNREEDGTEIQIFTDSPSYKCTVPIDYAYARHGWMRLPFVAYGVTTIPISLKAPLTFVVVRVRQFNANGNGTWNEPGGGAGERFEFVQSAGTDAPNAPSEVGMIVVGTPVGPVEPPVDPPPDPPPVDGGSVTNFSMPGQFSGTQGESGWEYKDSSGADLTFDAPTSVWRLASQSYLSIWGGAHPGPTLGAMYRFTVPNSSSALVTGTVGLYSSPAVGKSGTFVVKHNATVKFTQIMSDTTQYALQDQIGAAFAVTAGDFIDFILTSNQVDNSNLSTQTSLAIALTSGGSPTNPVAANITPAVLPTNTNTVNSVVVSLSSAAIVNATVVLSSSDGAVATVPSSVLVPAGQAIGRFDITIGAVAGSAIITATYNGGSAQCSVVASNPSTGVQWPNEPSGMIVVTDTPFSDSLPSEWFNVYNTQAYASPGGTGTAFSPPRAFDEFMAAGSNTGNGQWGINFPHSGEIYMGMYWSTNADFVGYANTTNKMIFFRDRNLDNSFLNWHGAPGAAKQIKWYFQSPYSNAHIVGWDGDATGVSGRLSCNVNGTAATMTAGSGWHFIELYLKKSTTSTSQNGIVKWWVNGTLCGSYSNCNLCPNGIDEMQLTAAWDGSPSGRDLTKSWHHYFDHLYISRKV